MSRTADTYRLNLLRTGFGGRAMSRRAALKGLTATTVAVAAPVSLARVAGAQDATTSASPAATSLGASGEVVIYSGRTEDLIAPAIEIASEATGVEAEVRYGQTAELAITILEEGENSPASLYIAQDAGALGQLANEGRLAPLPDEILNRVEERFRSPDGLWVGISGRARVLAYNTEMLTEADLPASILDLTAEEWRGQIGWAPENGSFQSHITAFRSVLGEDETRAWLEGMLANEPVTFESNGAIVQAVAAGEIAAGLVNHYYKWEIEAEQGEAIPVENYHFPSGDIGSLINVAGVAILAGSPNPDQALALVDSLTGTEAQTYFAEATSEYPLIDGVEPRDELVPLAEIQTPEIDLSDLDDLQGTLELLTEVGVL